MHICSETIIVEFLRDGQPANEGEMASIIVTPFFHYGMPLIRYEIGDAAHWIRDACPCGRGLPLMSHVEGRIIDILVAPDGRLMCYSTFHTRIFEHIDVVQYRIIQENVKSIMIELIPGKNYTDEAEKFIITSIRKYMGQEVEVSVKLREKIEDTPSGKRRVVISHVPVKL